ncbi:MAG: elongation factor EF-2, partial [Methanocorpusculum sp.]|nr:elongation factor EF-2 [Methanocorpusculum sp.]
SPNRHNRFFMTVEPMPEAIVNAIQNNEVTMNMDNVARRDVLVGLGLDKEEAKGVKDIYGSNMFLDCTKGIQYLNETMELIIDGIHEALDGGPLADEQVQNVLIKLHDVKLHEDAIHRGPGQVIPAVRGGIKAALLMAGDTLLEPMQNIQITVPQDQMGAAISQIQGRRGMLSTTDVEGDQIVVNGTAPVAELFGFAGDIRSATEGRAMWSTAFAGFAQVPQGMLAEIVKGIRKRKGLKEEIPTPKDYLE